LGIWGCQRTALCAGNDAPWKLGASRRYRFDYATRNSSRDWALASAIFPVGLALFDQCAQPFLGILEAIKLIEKNIHRLLEAVA
jgi:hypothetical protein